jgi:hypothetical protein
MSQCNQFLLEDLNSNLKLKLEVHWWSKNKLSWAQLKREFENEVKNIRMEIFYLWCSFES